MQICRDVVRRVQPGGLHLATTHHVSLHTNILLRDVSAWKGKDLPPRQPAVNVNVAALDLG
jgi:hypothetical protein